MIADSPNPVGVAARPPAPDTATLRFRDAEGAAQWLRTLPLTNVGEAHGEVHATLRALSAAELPARERARIAEVLRDRVAFLHIELARRYAGKPQPASERDREAADAAIALWHALWEQYSACLKPLLEGDPELASVKAKLLQRGLHVGKELLLVHGLARRIPPPELWQELHAYFRLAEMLECSEAAVSDPLITHGVGISCYSTYSHALLLSLADPCAMSVKQIQLADRWLQMWARKVHPTAVPRDGDGQLILVDLERPTGAALAAAVPSARAPSLRYASAGRLETSVRGRLKRLQTGSNPAELRLGHDCSVEQCTTLLSYLDWRWHQPPRQAAGTPATTLGLCSGGLDAAFYRVGGRTFGRRAPVRPYGARNAHVLTTLDALSDFDHGKEQAERAWPWERWEGTYEWREASLFRKGSAHYQWHLDQLLIVRDDERVRAGYVTRVAQDGSELAVAVRLWSGMPKALTLRPVTGALAEAPTMPALFLGEAPDEKPCLIVPPRTFNPSRVLRSVESGAVQKFRLTRLLQRGADFERVAFETA